jgi:signal transduction histidine kinase
MKMTNQYDPSDYLEERQRLEAENLEDRLKIERLSEEARLKFEHAVSQARKEFYEVYTVVIRDVVEQRKQKRKEEGREHLYY